MSKLDVEELKKDEGPYSLNGPFEDPVVRCDSCGRIVLVQSIKEHGQCPYCGRNKYWRIKGFSDEELIQMKKWDVDPEFLKLFQLVEGL